MKKFMYIVIVFVLIIAVFAAIDGSFMPKKYNSIYKEDYIDSLETDIEKIIAYAIGAPSGHNMQPWFVKIINKNTIELYANMNKELPVIDANHNQLLMSQGTFIQKFVEWAGEYGYSVAVDYETVDLSSQMPMIAQLSIDKTGKAVVDTLSASTGANFTETEINLFRSIDNVMSEYSGLSYEYIDEGDEFIKLQQMLLLGTIAESEDIAATKELLDVFRWTEYQKNEYRYGLSLNSMPGIIKPFIQPIMKMSSKDVESFGQSGISMFKDRIKDDVGYILIKSDSPESIDFIKSGEAYQSLISKCGGYAIRPAVQLLEEFNAMKELNTEFQSNYGEEGEVVLILTVQVQSGLSSNNPRHLVEDIIID